MANDFYSILGVKKDASKAEIKSAYRKMALKWHPDKNKSDDADKKFKEINNAYEVLSDEKKRQTYDQLGHEAYKKYGSRAGAAGAGDPYGGQGGSYQQGPFKWTYTSSGDGGSNPFEDFDFGGSDPFDIFEQFFGGGFGRQQARKAVYQMNISFDESFQGVEKTVSIEGESKKVNIPAGVDNGTRIRFADFDVIVSVSKDKTFNRDGQDVYTVVEIPFTKAVLGDTVKVPTLEKKKVKVKVKPGTRHGSMLRLQGKGFPHLRQLKRGDQYIVFNITYPDKLSKKQKELIEELDKTL